MNIVEAFEIVKALGDGVVKAGHCQTMAAVVRIHNAVTTLELYLQNSNNFTRDGQQDKPDAPKGDKEQ